MTEPRFNMSFGIQTPLTQYKDKWKKILATEFPQTLFHYTDLPGVVGITQSKQIWLSKASYLNDYSEVRFFLKRINRAIKTLPDFGINSNSLKLVENIVFNIQQDFYICSFCTDGDLLSQWRAYTDNGAGISLGLSVQHLSKIARDNGLHLIKCIYPEAEQDGIAISLILNAIDNIENNNSDTALDEIRDNICLAALACKNPNFSEEQEWRLVLINKNNPKHSFGVRAKGSQLVPYYKLDLPVWSKKGVVVNCYIGPTAAFNNIEEGLRILISDNLCEEFAIRESCITYR